MMATIIDGLCFIILGTCIIGGLVFLYGGMDDKKPASVLMGAAFFFLGILLFLAIGNRQFHRRYGNRDKIW